MHRSAAAAPRPEGRRLETRRRKIRREPDPRTSYEAILSITSIVLWARSAADRWVRGGRVRNTLADLPHHRRHDTRAATHRRRGTRTTAERGREHQQA